MEVRIDRSDDLTHWGIKGQKWGVRRYQNPDGTLTEAGKKRYYYQNPDGSLTDEGRKHYMTAAKKGKINPKKLSDADLNMINSRFAREKQYAQNISEYEKSKFSYKMKEAAIARIKGNGGGGGGKKGGANSAIGNLLAMPIKKAFEDAFKFDPNKGVGKDDGGSEAFDKETRDAYRQFKRSSKRDRAASFVKGYEPDKATFDRHKKKGQERFEDWSRLDWRDNKTDKKTGTQANRKSGSRTAEEVIRARHKSTPKPKPQPKKDETPKRSNRLVFTSNGWMYQSGIARYRITRNKKTDPDALTT